ncbi:hypothetical protein BD626DRAFT_461896 [Schizophyllum amplum]|uniref:Xylanolytic transcriptional activator regulatory domain-containing protein n=1 Tax=Schizophyllum amplum TaxID=97359 RepID=A0A550C4V2_9AGAR|nr:hypothetical protein BD626DRAFT_461896 [Auriculariopsis ampla]
MPSAQRKNASALQRGTACLCCSVNDHRSQKCDGTRPVCRQCIKMNRADECEFDDKKQKSRTQKLREKLAMLEKKVRELEADTHGESSTSGSSSGSSPQECASPDADPIADALLAGDGLGAYDLASLDGLVFPGLDELEAHPDLAISNQAIDLVNSVLTDPLRQPHNPTNAIGSDNLSLSAWDQDHGLPDANREVLLNIFIAHRHQCWFDGDISRFNHASPDREPHPALWNAVYLLGCHYAQSPYFAEWEPVFFSHTLREITVALDSSDRLVDVVQASCLLAVYLYANARALEGYCHSFSAARLAVGLGLHQLPAHEGPGLLDDTLGEHVAPIPIPPPRDTEEHRDRVAAFWQVFMVDRCWSVANGLPVALPDGESDQIRITTPWPRAPGEECPVDWLGSGPINALMVDHGSFDPPTVYMPALRAKAAALYERAARLSSRPQLSESSWMESQVVGSALQRFISILPPLASYEPWRTHPPYLDVELLVVHSIAHVASIHAGKDVFAMQSFLSSNSVMALIRQLSDADYEFLDPVISSCWCAVARFYMRVLGAMQAMITTPMPPYTMEGIHTETTVIIHALQALGKFIPLAGEHCKRIKEEWAAIALL